MRLDLSLSQRPEMQLKLSPQLIQRIEILQLPAHELIELIRQECAENETIEVEPARVDAAPADGAKELAGEEVSERIGAELERMTGYQEALRRRVRGDGERDAKMEAMANAPEGPGTLGDHLLEQISFANLDDGVRGFAEILVRHLDENGFLREPVEELLIPYDEEFTREQAASAHEFLKTLEPVGVGARDMRECFLMQLDPDHVRHDLHRKIVGDHLEDWRENRLPKIAREADVDVEAVKEAMDDLREILSPPPGRLFREDVVVPVRPDIVVEKVEDQWEVRLEDDFYPTVTVSPEYVSLSREGGMKGKARRELKGKLDRARFLIEAIEQRKNTLMRVAVEIVEHQREFLDHGPLRPLKMRDVADRLGLHVSTVSRAISDKWMQMPRGVFPLKHFFTGAAPGGEGGGGESRDSVRQKVQEIIDAEDKSKPLSDEDIVKKLKEAGLGIARRTVTKYRKMMNIPSSRQRREY